MKNIPLASLLLSVMTAASYADLVTFGASSDLTSSFTEIRSNANDVYSSGTGSDGSTAGYFQYTMTNPTTDGNAIRYAYDANGATAGSSTYSTGYAAMDVRWNTANTSIGLFFAPTTADALGWQFRPDNSGSMDNSKAVYGLNLTNNYSGGTILTTSSGTSATMGSSTPAMTTSSDVYSTSTLTTGSWYSMRLDFTLDGSSNRVLQLRIWDNVLDTGSGTGTGTLKWDQTLTINGGLYAGAGQVGFYGVNGALATTIDVDNFMVSAPVPEPGTWVLIVLGVALVAYSARRRQRA